MPRPISRDAIFGKLVRAFSRDMERIHDGDAAALHRTRVASRRLRELLPILGLARDQVRKLSRRLTKVTRRLGTVRELDVHALLVRELSGNRGYPPMALRELATSIAAAQSSARARLATKLPLAKLKRLARRLERAIGQRDAKHEHDARAERFNAKHSWLWALDARSVRRATHLMASIGATSALYVPEQLHEIRIALKKLRYAEELRAEAGGRPSPDLATLKTAQDLLGRLHDLELLVARAREAQALMSASHLMACHQLGLLVRVLEENCRRLHGRHMRQRAQLVAIATRIAGMTVKPADEQERAAG